MAKDSIVEKLLEQYKYVFNLRDDLKDIILLYTGSDYEELNDNLREGNILTEIHKKMIDGLDEIFNGVPPIQEPIIVYRGIKNIFKMRGIY